MKNSKRILYAYPITEMASSEMNHSQNTDQSNNEPPLDQICTTASSEPNLTIDHEWSRYNIDNNINNKIVYSKPICKDNDVKEKTNKVNMSREQENKFLDLVLACSYTTRSGWRELLSELTKEELKQVENYMKENRKDTLKESLNELLQNKSFVKQKQI